MARKRRRTTYKDWTTEEGIIKIEGFARDGMVNEEIAQRIGIHPSTLYDWQSEYPEIAEALKRGKEVVDRQVENALLKRAMGYSYTEQVSELVKDPMTGSISLQVVKEIKKEVAPDTTAQIFWLKNRKPAEWRDRKEVEVSTKNKLEDFFSGD